MSSIWTRPELEEQISIYKAALKACASGASYTIGTRSLTRQDMAAIRDHLDYLALRAALASARKEAASIARDTYTARKARLFDRIEADYAGGKLTLHGAFGLSLYHFKPSHAKPGERPAGGVTSQVKRKGPRYAHRDPRFSHGAPFVMAKRQGGYGIFVRRTGGKLPGWKGVHMLFGPSPMCAG